MNFLLAAFVVEPVKILLTRLRKRNTARGWEQNQQEMNFPLHWLHAAECNNVLELNFPIPSQPAEKVKNPSNTLNYLKQRRAANSDTWTARSCMTLSQLLRQILERCQSENGI